MGERGLQQRKNCKDSQDNQPCFHGTVLGITSLVSTGQSTQHYSWLLSNDTEEKL